MGMEKCGKMCENVENVEKCAGDPFSIYYSYVVERISSVWQNFRLSVSIFVDFDKIDVLWSLISLFKLLC